MAEDGLTSLRCELDRKGCLSLESILHSFNAPISEEQAWSLLYQCGKAIKHAWEKDECLLVSATSHVKIHKDGHVHWSTVSHLEGIRDAGRVLATSEGKLVSELGVVVFLALDYGLKQNEERHLSSDLDELIDSMTSAGQLDRRHRDPEDGDAIERHETDDEGIVRDSGDDDDDKMLQAHPLFSLDQVIERCTRHLSIIKEVDSHYRAVCRALVAEAIELSFFLEKVAHGTQQIRTQEEECTDLDNLQFTDWARLWVQVIRELRNGVKLKKVDYIRRPIEFELTPYEILMEDIRSRRYKLNKVMVDGELPPRVKRDAHEIILEFIRSRPPLKKASERKLAPPPRKVSTQRELVMEDIRKEHNLRPTATRQKKMETSRTRMSAVDPSPQPTKKLLKVDPCLLQLNFDDDDDDDFFLGTPTEPHSMPDEQLPDQEDHNTSPWHRAVALDLATQCAATYKPVERRHSITVCESPTRHGSGTSSPFDDHSSLPTNINSSSTLQNEFFTSPHWQITVECLSLTLEEVVHIRSVLTKAELDNLPVECSLKEDVEKNKLCFLCLKTRFSFFGPWGQKCKLCKRTVCARCCSKMRIPTEHFAAVPVYTISPSALSPTKEEKESLTRAIMSRLQVPQILNSNSVGSAPSSPNINRKSRPDPTETTQSSPDQTVNGEMSHSMPPLCNVEETSLSKRKISRSKTIAKSDDLSQDKQEKLRGSLMNVCNDCKAMVLNVIKSSRAKREKAKSSQSPKHLHLNLSPVYP